jgi:hypothetical protein
LPLYQHAGFPAFIRGWHFGLLDRNPLAKRGWPLATLFFGLPPGRRTALRSPIGPDPLFCWGEALQTGTFSG